MKRLFRHLVRLFDEYTVKQTINALKTEINTLHLDVYSRDEDIKNLKKQVETAEKHRDDINLYCKSLIQEFEGREKMTFTEFAEWHNNYVNNKNTKDKQL